METLSGKQGFACEDTKKSTNINSYGFTNSKHNYIKIDYFFVIPPKEAKVSLGKVWKLKRAAYGLIDFSRGFFLNQSSKLQQLGFEALQMDPASFILMIMMI